jgi:hypothetical protein
MTVLGFPLLFPGIVNILVMWTGCSIASYMASLRSHPGDNKCIAAFIYIYSRNKSHGVMIHYTCESHVFTIFVTCANHVHFMHKVTDYIWRITFKSKFNYPIGLKECITWPSYVSLCSFVT